MGDSKFLKNTLLIAGNVMVILLFVIFVLVLRWYFVEYDVAIPLQDGSSELSESWSDVFFNMMSLCIGIVSLFVIIRFALEELIFKGDGSVVGRWLIMLVFSAVAGIVISILSNIQNPLSDGLALVCLSYIIVPMLLYYFATLLFSPNPVKYAVPFARFVRQW
jgi:hypothetical protein